MDFTHLSKCWDRHKDHELTPAEQAAMDESFNHYANLMAAYDLVIEAEDDPDRQRELRRLRDWCSEDNK